MKTWITYIAALLMGLAAALLMSSIDLAYEIISSVSSFLVSFGMFITIPVVFISFAVAEVLTACLYGAFAWAKRSE